MIHQHEIDSLRKKTSELQERVMVLEDRWQKLKDNIKELEKSYDGREWHGGERIHIRDVIDWEEEVEKR